jgi:hypothetical protein
MTYNEDAYSNHLQELHSSQFEMVKGEPDIRNWRVFGIQNQEVGRVNDLLFDDLSHRVRYLIVDVNGKPLNLISRLVLIPVGFAELLRDEKVVVITGLTVGHLASLPAYEKGKITSVTEHSVRTVFSPPGTVVYQDEDRNNFYNHAHFNDERFYRTPAEVTRRDGLKEEMKQNIERVKETVKKMENDLEKLERTNS